MDTSTGSSIPSPASFTMPPRSRPVDFKRIALLAFLAVAALVTVIAVVWVLSTNKQPATTNTTTNSTNSEFWNTSLLGSRPVAASRQSSVAAGAQTCVSDPFTYKGKQHTVSLKVAASWICTNVFIIGAESGSTESYSMTISSNDQNQIIINPSNISPGSICVEGSAGCEVQDFYKNSLGEFKLYRTETGGVRDGQIASTAIDGIGRVTIRYRNIASADLTADQKALVIAALDSLKLD